MNATPAWWREIETELPDVRLRAVGEDDPVGALGASPTFDGYTPQWRPRRVAWPQSPVGAVALVRRLAAHRVAWTAGLHPRRRVELHVSMAEMGDPVFTPGSLEEGASGTASGFSRLGGVPEAEFARGEGFRLHEATLLCEVLTGTSLARLESHLRKLHFSVGLLGPVPESVTLQQVLAGDVAVGHVMAGESLARRVAGLSGWRFDGLPFEIVRPPLRGVGPDTALAFLGLPEPAGVVERACLRVRPSAMALPDQAMGVRGLALTAGLTFARDLAMGGVDFAALRLIPEWRADAAEEPRTGVFPPVPARYTLFVGFATESPDADVLESRLRRFAEMQGLRAGFVPGDPEVLFAVPGLDRVGGPPEDSRPISLPRSILEKATGQPLAPRLCFLPWSSLLDAMTELVDGAGFDTRVMRVFRGGAVVRVQRIKEDPQDHWSRLRNRIPEWKGRLLAPAGECGPTPGEWSLIEALDGGGRP